MKIFYAIQGTGNGHISRAIELYPHLKKFGDVDFFLSGSNSDLKLEIPIKYRSKGCSLHYSQKGGLDYCKIIKNTNPIQIFKDAKSLPLKNYDFVINDFESVTSLACKIQKLRSVQFGHQASFLSKKTPRPEIKNKMGEFIFKNYSSSPKNVGLHFKKYDSFIFDPIIKNQILNANPKNLDHITIYLPSINIKFLETALNKLRDQHFHWFLKEIDVEFRKENITYYPINQMLFNESLINCKGIITGGGFETPAEALYLNKKVLCIPIQNHYEQACNSTALNRLGITVLNKIGKNFEKKILNWLDYKVVYPTIVPNKINETLEYLFDTYNND